MFYTYKNHSEKPDLDGFPKWMIVQADNASEANAMMVRLVGQKNMSTEDTLELFDLCYENEIGALKPMASGWSLTSGEKDFERLIPLYTRGTYLVHYTDGTVVAGKLGL